ncbi:MAG: hypothetical protein D6681_00860 [Calditrichaeota bacterium]|nr:MAG: hypothetical protein D6681_00860 [Calditrichota bacterium]
MSSATKALPGIKKMPVGKPFVTFCVVRKSEIQYKQSGEPYLVLELGDRSGRLKARIWKKPLEYARIAPTGSIVKIQAVVKVYQDRKELAITRMRQATAEDPVRLTDLLPASEKDVEALRRRLSAHVEGLDHPHLKQLLSRLFDHRDFREAFFLSPAGKLWHHNYLSGLLEHVVTLLDLADTLAVHYPEIDLPLLKTGIICHGVGKVREYSLKGFIDFSDEGRLLGYVAMGYEWIAREIGQIEGFPGELKIRLLHLILSHPGETEGGAAVAPMTLEAVALQHLIQLDASVNALCRIVKNDAVPGSRWTKFIPLLERFIYVGNTSENPSSPADPEK